APRFTQISRSGGSKDNEVTALAVKPNGSPSAVRPVTTVTGAAKSAIAERNAAPSTGTVPAIMVSDQVICSRTLRGRMSVHTVSMWSRHSLLLPVNPARVQPGGGSVVAGQIE